MATRWRRRVGLGLLGSLGIIGAVCAQSSTTDTGRPATGDAPVVGSLGADVAAGREDVTVFAHVL